MTYDEMIKMAEEHRRKKEEYKKGNIKVDMSEECRKNWIEKCNA